MTGLLCALLLAASPSAPAPAAANAKATPASLLVVPILPSARQFSDEDLALAIQMRAIALLGQTGRYADLSVKQVLRMAEREGVAPSAFSDPATLAALAPRLGAPRAVSAHLVPAEKGWTLEIRDEKSKAPASVSLPSAFAEAVSQGGAALAGAVAKVDGVALPSKVAAETANDEAARLLAGCQASLVRQPIGIETPSVLGENLDTALEACASAARLDPNLSAAHAGMALAFALKGEDDKAVRALSNAKQDSSYLPNWWIARYWLLTRYQSNEAGARALSDAVERHPGFLLARGYLAEHLNAVGKHEEALAAWKKYAEAVPKSPFVQARIGYTLAKLGRHAEAIEATRGGLKLDPASRDLQLELASRQVDSGDLKGARATLEPLAKDPRATGEVLLRLGYVLLLQGEFGQAEPLLRAAVDKATRPAEWRTRGRAKLDLAKLMVRRGQKDQARAVMLEAIREGYRPLTLSRPDPDLEELAKAAAAEADKPEQKEKGKDLKVDLKPRYAMPSIGAPLGLKHTLTAGVVSALRDDPRALVPRQIIQTDAALNSGNSGGALFNYKGEVVGVASYIATLSGGSMGLGFAVPSNTVRNRLFENALPYLGTSLRYIPKKYADIFNWPVDGLLVERVEDGSPAAGAGLRGGQVDALVDGTPVRLGGDYILKVGELESNKRAEVAAYLHGLKEGDTIRYTVMREGRVGTVDVKVGKFPPLPAMPKAAKPPPPAVKR